MINCPGFEDECVCMMIMHNERFSRPISYGESKYVQRQKQCLNANVIPSNIPPNVFQPMKREIHKHIVINDRPLSKDLKWPYKCVILSENGS